MIQHPAIRKPDSGLSFLRGSYHARYYQDGRQKFKCLSTDDPDTARRIRDVFYASLGAEPRDGKRGRPRIAAPGTDPSSLPPGVTYRKPWCVSRDGVSLGQFHTLKEAKEAMGAWDAAQTEGCENVRPLAPADNQTPDANGNS